MSDESVALSTSGGAVGDRVRELRTRSERSQAWLARQMHERGFRWHQPTVHRVEAGEQEATFKEAVALADIFAVPVESFARQAS